MKKMTKSSLPKEIVGEICNAFKHVYYERLQKQFSYIFQNKICLKI